MRQDQFDGNRLIEAYMTGAPDLADAAGADPLLENVIANLVPCFQSIPSRRRCGIS
jgi:hypothetical protein